MDVMVEAGVLTDFLTSAYFTPTILNMSVEFTENNMMRIAATGVANDRLVVCKYPATKVVEPGEWGIGDIYNVISKLSNFARTDELRVYLDTKLNKVVAVRQSKKKLYKFPIISGASITSRSIFAIGVGDNGDIRVKNLSKNSTSVFGRFLTSFTPDIEHFKKIMKNKDSFTNNVKVSVSPDGEVRLSTTAEDGTEAIEILDVVDITAPDIEMSSEYSLLHEVISNIKKGSSIEMFLGNDTGMLVRERGSKIGMTQFFVMPVINK